MKFTEIYRFNESLNNPFPYKEISNSSWVIDTGTSADLVVRMELQNVDGYLIAHISFNTSSPKVGKPELTNVFDGGGASRVFASIIDILQTQKGIDLLIFVPDDIDVNVAGKKSRLYKVIMRRLLASNVLVRHEEFPISPKETLLVAFPAGSKLWDKQNTEILKLLEEFLFNKTN
jgi:hypothetical protein